MVETICANTVARAAPLMPSFGKKERPKIKKGSNIKFIRSEIIDILKGVMEFPLAKNAADKTGFKKVKIRPALTIKR